MALVPVIISQKGCDPCHTDVDRDRFDGAVLKVELVSLAYKMDEEEIKYCLKLCMKWINRKKLQPCVNLFCVSAGSEKSRFGLDVSNSTLLVIMRMETNREGLLPWLRHPVQEGLIYCESTWSVTKAPKVKNCPPHRPMPFFQVSRSRYN